MKKIGITVISLVCLFNQPSRSGNAQPESKGPQEKSCVASATGTCTVSLSDVKNGTQRTATCTANQGAECKVRLNAVDETPQVDLKTLKVKPFGSITKELTSTIDLPQKEGDSTVFSFTPTAGDLATKELTVLVYKTKNPIGTRHYGKTLINIFRLIAGDKPNNWQKMGQLESTRPVEDLKTGVVIVKPDGTVLIPSPVQGEPPVAMAMGTKVAR